MICEQPVVLRWGSPREFLQLFVSKNTEARVREDWRVRKLRNLIDSNRARAQWTLKKSASTLTCAFRPAGAQAFQGMHRNGHQGIRKEKTLGSRSGTVANHGCAG